MPDQSAEATLKYILDSGMSARRADGRSGRELRRRADVGRGGGPGGAGARAARGGDAAGGGAGRPRRPASLPQGEKMGEWNGQQLRHSRAAAAARCGGGGGGGGRGRGQPTPEQQAAQEERAARSSRSGARRSRWTVQAAAQDVQRRRRHHLRLEATACRRTEHVRRGVRVHLQRRRRARLHAHDDRAAGRANAEAHAQADGDFAKKKKIYAAYHTHAQGSMTVFDQAFALSKGNMANVDFGHCVAAGNVGGTPMQFLREAPRPHRQLPPEGSDDAGTLLAQPAVGHG